HLDNETITINDPACGSGIFLCEAIRSLQRRKYGGRVVVVGRDISPDAAQMAKFSLACAALDWPGNRIEWSVDAGDFFVGHRKERFDIIVMNPPFLQWEALTTEQRAFVRDTLQEKYAGRPDLSVAFVQQSLKRLAPGGTLATLLPRGVLDSQRGRKWRESLLADNDVRLIGTFGEHGLFRHAMVSISAAVFERKKSDAPAILIWADERPHSAEGALRALRRRGTGSQLDSDRSSSW